MFRTAQLPEGPCLTRENGNVPVPVLRLRRVRPRHDTGHDPHGHPVLRRHRLRVTVPRRPAVHTRLIPQSPVGITGGRLMPDGRVPDGGTQSVTYDRMPYGADRIAISVPKRGPYGSPTPAVTAAGPTSARCPAPEDCGVDRTGAGTGVGTGAVCAGGVGTGDAG